jgi:parvulin-like peptidyl-prolyl isomerase
MLRAIFLSLFSLALAAQAGAQTARPAKQPAGNPAGPKTIGQIAGEIYSEKDFQDFLPLLYPPNVLEQNSGRPEFQAQAKKSFLETMLLVQLAKKVGMDRSPEFQALMANFTKALIAQEIVKKNEPELRARATPSEEQIKAYFQENINNYMTEEVASARHILIMARANENDASKPTDEQALTMAKKIHLELQDGKNWQEAAQQYSDDPGSRESGGLYENFNPAQMVPEFAHAVRTQAIGALGGPVRTQYGYHVILVENFQPARNQTYEEAKPAAQRQLASKMQNETWNSFIDSLKAEFGYSETQDAEPKQAAER